MITPCPNCRVDIEIDPATHATLQGQTHFACPACQGAVPVPVTARPRLKVNPALATQASAPVPSLHRPPDTAARSRGINRNLLILGSVALLVLGGIGFLLASRSSDIFNTQQKITRQIINNTYFQNLVASGAVKNADLQALAAIRPCDDGFWGVSEDLLNWQQAQELAIRCGGEIFEVSNSTTCWPNLLVTVETKYPRFLSTSVWVQEENQARARLLGKTQAPDSQLDHSAEGRHRVLLYWNPSKPIDNTLPWVHEEVPPADKDGWITLFDGTHLHGVSRNAVRRQSNIGVQNGHLWLDRRMLTFNIKARNVSVRAEAKKLSGQNLALRCRSERQGRYLAWFNGNTGFGIGMNYMDPNYKYRDLKNATSPDSYSDFFEMEFIALDQTLTLKAEGRTLTSIEDAAHDHFGAVVISALQGRSSFRKVQVKILD